MSTPTTIQTHIAYGSTNNENPAAAVSDLNRFAYLRNSREEAAEGGENSNEVAQKAPIKSARKVTLDDLGGRSDALGG